MANRERKNVLITGGVGFIGSYLTRELVKKGYFVRIIDNLYRGSISKVQDLINDKKVEFVEGDIRYLSKVLQVCENIDFIFHEVADCINKSLQNPSESFNINVTGSNNVFEAARIKKIKKVIFASSASVYGDPETLPMNEESPLNPITPYCIGKLTLEKIAEFYSRFHNIDYIGFRYFNVYGPGQNVDAFYTNVVISFLKRIMNDQAPLIKGDGKQSMDFIHIKDIVSANILALESEINNEIFNLGTNKSTTIAQLAEILLNSIGKKELEPICSGEKSIVKERRADYSKAKKLLNWEPKIPVEEGLAEIAQDIFKENSTS